MGTRSEHTTEELDYEDIVSLCKQHTGTIIRIANRDEERVHFSTHRHPEQHSTLIRASIWKTTVPNLSGPRWQISAGRGLDGMSGGTSIVNEGNEHYETYWEAVERIEELAAEYDGEPIRWRDLPKRVYLSTGEKVADIYTPSTDE